MSANRLKIKVKSTSIDFRYISDAESCISEPEMEIASIEDLNEMLKEFKISTGVRILDYDCLSLKVKKSDNLQYNKSSRCQMDKGLF